MDSKGELVLDIEKVVRYIVEDEEKIEDWVELEPVVFLKNNMVYGLVSIQPFKRGVVVNSCTKNNGRFTFEMIKYIRRLANLLTLYIVHDKRSKNISINIVRTFSKKLRIKTVVLDKIVLTIVKRRSK